MIICFRHPKWILKSGSFPYLLKRCLERQCNIDWLIPSNFTHETAFMSSHNKVLPKLIKFNQTDK